MRPPCLEPHAQQRIAVEQLLDLKMCDRGTRRVGVERVPHTVAAVAADRRVDRAAPRARLSDDEREVLAHELAVAHEPLQLFVRLRRACDDHQAGRVAVEAVDDPRALVLLPALGADERDRLRERPARVTGAGMDDDARRLVDDEQMVVLVRRSSSRAARRRASPERRRPRTRRSRRRRACGSSRAPLPSTRTVPASSSRSAAPREPTSGNPASQRSRRIPAASGGTSMTVTRGRRGRARRG